MKKRFRIPPTVFLVLITISALSAFYVPAFQNANLLANDDPKSSDPDWQQLFDPQMKQWEVFMGVPHDSVDVDWHSKSESGTKGTPMGLNNDPLNVFTMHPIDGVNTLKVTGQIYGGLSTLKEYENYHLSIQFKWGEKKWPPRENSKRDSGLLIHCVGNHGAFWNVWMRSLECQVQEGDVGDFIALAGSGSNVRVKKIKGHSRPQFDATQPLHSGTGYVTHSPSPERPHGEWNTVEVYAIGQTTVFVVNGTPNMMLEQSVQRGKQGWSDQVPLTKGKIQIQSEAAEVYYRNAKIRSISEFPESLKAMTQPFKGKVTPFEEGA